MSWVGIQSSGIEFTFSELVGGDGSASLSGSVATTDNGTPPVAGPYAAWEIIFSDTVGRADLLLRVTAQSYADSGDSAFPSMVAIADDSGAVVGDFFENTAGSSAWAPSPMEFDVAFGSGDRSLTNRPTGEFSAQTSAFLIEVWVDDPAPASPTCEEIGRVTRNYVSAHTRERVHNSVLYAPEVRCLVTNFNGAIPAGRSIVSATWQSWDTSIVAMSSPVVLAREVQVKIRAQYAGEASILVVAVLDNGEVYTAWHFVRVNCAPYFNNQGWQDGPGYLTASAG